MDIIADLYRNNLYRNDIIFALKICKRKCNLFTKYESTFPCKNIIQNCLEIKN